jgi:hypothetical protein
LLSATVVEQRVEACNKITERRAVEMVGTRIYWQLQTRRPLDLVVHAWGNQQLSAMAMATNQGDCVAADDVHVTDTKFSTRLGPPPLRPPV